MRGGVRVVFVEDFGVFFVFVVAAGTDAALGSFEALNNQPPVVGATNRDRRNNVTARSLIVWIVDLCAVHVTQHNVCGVLMLRVSCFYVSVLYTFKHTQHNRKVVLLCVVHSTAVESKA